MKFIIILGCLAILSCGIQAENCDEAKSPDDSDFKHFFKNLGCKVSNGADKAIEVAKPYAEKIGEGAKDLGSSVVQKYDELKHRLSSDDSKPNTDTKVTYDAPTERVPLAPIAPAIPSEISNPQPITAAG